jgi:hypothetical protein
LKEIRESEIIKVKILVKFFNIELFFNYNDGKKKTLKLFTIILGSLKYLNSFN